MCNSKGSEANTQTNEIRKGVIVRYKQIHFGQYNISTSVGLWCGSGYRCWNGGLEAFGPSPNKIAGRGLRRGSHDFVIRGRGASKGDIGVDRRME